MARGFGLRLATALRRIALSANPFKSFLSPVVDAAGRRVDLE
jgi:hypothetical protein